MKKFLILFSLLLISHPYAVGSFSDKDLPKYMPEKSMDDVLELRLKARDLVEQFMEGNVDIFQNKTILLTDIVNITNLKSESSLGKVFTEELYNEFVKRGISVREYRISNTIANTKDSGNYFLSERTKNIVMQNNELVMVGTYNISKENVTLNARILEPSSGLVQKTASIFFQKTPYVVGLTQKQPSSVIRTMEIKAIEKENTKKRTVPKVIFDRGIH